jgi:hypothetical protein
MKKHDRVPEDLAKAKFEIPELEEIASSLAAADRTRETKFAS